ncbi:MAG: YbjN domain-containing protein [Flammeovirgaceae bacterium]|nr:YbjN domain-containing protein [Flammeovirgaceae bacterium]MDW8287747.1 YbjN domain-containing protein [Flammeovirgaceae bacterium]
MNDLTPYYQMLEECIAYLGVDPATARTGEEGHWALTKGSALVWVFLQRLPQNDNEPYFWVISPVATVPDQNKEKFYQELLETNHTLYGSAFTKYDKYIYVKTIREVEGITKEDMLRMLQSVGTYADMYDDVLFSKYGVRL